MTSAIEMSRVVKTFGPIRALDEFDLTVRVGEVHGFLGPNGAGKSTAIRVLLGLLRTDSGETSLLSGDPWSDAVSLHRQLAYVPGDVTLWPKLTGGEVIDLLTRLRGGGNEKKRAAYIDKFELDPTKKARTYSKGNRQKVALIAALASDVELLILDEPTSGLDPLMELVFQDSVAEAKADGRTVLLSSHILAEVEALCDRVTIIRDGRTVEVGKLNDLRHNSRTSVVARTERPVDFETAPGIHSLNVEGQRVTFEVESVDLDMAVSALAASHLLSLTTSPPTLEEIFLRHYGAAGETTNNVGGQHS